VQDRPAHGANLILGVRTEIKAEPVHGAAHLVRHRLVDVVVGGLIAAREQTE